MMYCKVSQQRNFSQETLPITGGRVISSNIGLNDQFWAVDGQVVRIRNGEIIRKKEEHELVANPKPMNHKRIRLGRIQRAAETKIRPGKVGTLAVF